MCLSDLVLKDSGIKFHVLSKTDCVSGLFEKSYHKYPTVHRNSPIFLLLGCLFSFFFVSDKDVGVYSNEFSRLLHCNLSFLLFVADAVSTARS